MRVSRLFSLLVVLSTASSVVACSATPVAAYNETKSKKNKSTADEDEETDGDTETEEETPKKTTPTPTPEPEPAATTATVEPSEIPAGGVCTTPTKKSACVGCCLSPSLGGTTGGAAGANAFTSCICGGVCASECGASYCTGKPPSATCNSCVQQRGMQCEDAAMGGAGQFDANTVNCLITCF